jgi:DNA-directed RNA polymerase specialized sigma24 family protein
MITNRALYQLSSDQLNRLESKYQHLPINHHDWQDLRQNIMIKIFRKKSLIKDGLNLKGWVHTLISHSFQNHMRDLLGQQNQGPSRRAKMNVRFPKRLMTRIKEENPWGDQYISYEPDLADESSDNVPEAARQQVTHIIDLLSPVSRDILKAYAKTHNWGATAKAVNLSYSTTYSAGLKAIAEVRRKLEVVS